MPGQSHFADGATSFAASCSESNFELALDLLEKFRVLGLKASGEKLVLKPESCTLRDRTNLAAPLQARQSCPAKRVGFSSPWSGSVPCQEGEDAAGSRPVVVCASWEGLPADVLLQVAALLGTRDVVAVTCVCTAWRAAVGAGTTRLEFEGGVQARAGQDASLAALAAWSFTALRHLRFSRCPGLQDDTLASLASSSARSLQHLWLLACTGVGTAGVAAAVRTAGAGLLTLDLSSCVGLTDEAFKAVGACCPQLQALSACGCSSLTDASLAAVGGGCPHLREANWGWCDQITDAGVQSLAAGCPRLQVLDLCGCLKVGDSGVVWLSWHCPDLSSISLHCCRRVTDAAVVSMEQQLDRLAALNLSGCRRVTPTAVQSLLDANPRLHTCKARRNVILGGCLALLEASCACPQQLLSPAPFMLHWP